MSWYNNISLLSQFSYAKQHFMSASEAFIKTTSSASKISALGEIALGILELTPIFGLFAAYIEKRTKNNTFEKRIAQRELYVKEQTASTSFALQSLYFDTQSSPRHYCNSDSFHERNTFYDDYKKFEALNDSYPDFQIFALVNDLTEFKATLEENSPEIAKIDEALAKLEKSKNAAMLVSEIMGTYTTTEKEALRVKLSTLLSTQIQEMNAGESIIIPGGYMNGNIYNLFGSDTALGHSITIKLIKELDNSFTMRLYDTAGSKHDRDPRRKNRVYPYIVQNITQASLLDLQFMQKLTELSYSVGNRKHEESHLYDLVNALGDKKTDYNNERSYNKQGNVNNCTKKSLQVWLHDELSDNELAYRKFRSFRIERSLAKVRPIMNRFWGLFYTIPLAALGGLTTNKAGSIAFSILGFLFGSKVSVKISNDTITKLFWYAKKVAGVRERKSKGERVEFEKLPAHIFMDSSIDVILNKILSQSTGRFSEKRLTALTALGAGLAVGHRPAMSGRSSTGSASVNSMVEDSEDSSEFNLDDIMDKLKTNNNKIAFLRGYVEKLVEMQDFEEAITLARSYLHIRNIKNLSEDISSVLCLINSNIDEFTNMETIDWEQIENQLRIASRYLDT